MAGVEDYPTIEEISEGEVVYDSEPSNVGYRGVMEFLSYFGRGFAILLPNGDFIVNVDQNDTKPQTKH